MIVYGGLAVAIIAVAATTLSYFKKSGPPERANEAYREANKLLANGDYSGAVSRFTEALRIYPKDAKSLVGRGNAQVALLDYPRAVKDFTAALKIDSSFIPAYTGLAWTQWLRGDLPGAISHLKEALLKDYDNRKIWSQIEAFLEEADDRAGVVKLYREPYQKYKSDLERASGSNRAEIEDQLAWVEMNYAGALSRAELWNELLSVSQAGSRRPYTGSSHSDELDHANTWRFFRGFAENHLHMQQEAIADFEAILDSLNDDPHYPPIAVSHVCEELYLAYLWTGNQIAADRANQNCDGVQKRLAAAIPTPSSEHDSEH